MRTIETQLDLEQIKKDCRRIDRKVVKEYSELEVPDKKSYQNTLAEQLDRAPMSSRLHDFYNVFTFPYLGINQLYRKISSVFHTINEYDEQYYVHAWLNYQGKGESIPWHYHWKGLSGLDRTYVATFYVNCEPSVTTYHYPNGEVIERSNTNNTIVIYEDTGDMHMVSEWTEDEPRISISMDFVPAKYVQSTPYLLNTWMPVI